MALDAEKHAREEALVAELARRISEVLDRRSERAAVLAWVRSVWPEGERIPALAWAAAEDVLCCLQDIDRPDIVREQDLGHYLRLLQYGDSCNADEMPLLTLSGTLAELSIPRRGETERWIVDGLGWYEGLRLVSGATGRPFVASMPLQPIDAPYVNISKPKSDEVVAALWDLFELLGIDETDATYIAPHVDIRALPAWRLCRLDDNAQEFEVERSRSRSKLSRRQKAFEDTGHRQSYWIERVG
jgi:hypothetical protein